MNYQFDSSFEYADNVIVTPTATEMCRLIFICSNFAVDFYISYNAFKSGVCYCACHLQRAQYCNGQSIYECTHVCCKMSLIARRLILS
jgi:hypothetical protein